MYRTIRNVHLAIGLLCGAYLFMYAWSAMQMSHREWFDFKPTITERTIALPGAPVDNPRAAARELMDKHGLRGELRQVQKTGEGFRLRFAQPGAITDVVYTAAKGEAVARRQQFGAGQTLNQMHHVAGLFHETLLFRLMGWFVAVVSLGMLILAGTGIYLWFKLLPERRVGAVLLIGNLVYCVVIFVAMRAG